MCKIATDQDESEKDGLINAKQPAQLTDPESPVSQHLGKGSLTKPQRRVWEAERRSLQAHPRLSRQPSITLGEAAVGT